MHGNPTTDAAHRDTQDLLMYPNGIFTKEEKWSHDIHSLHEKGQVTLRCGMRKAGIANAPHPSLEAPGTSHIS